jgi:hypothetical protein
MGLLAINWNLVVFPAAVIAIISYWIVTEVRLSNALTKRIRQHGFDIDSDVIKYTSQPVIEAYIRGKRRYFLVDTGAAVNCLSMKSYLNLLEETDSIIAGESTIITGIDSKDQEVQTVVENIIVDGMKYKITFTVIDSWEGAREQVNRKMGIELSGIIGYDFMKEAGWTINTRNNKILYNK